MPTAPRRPPEPATSSLALSTDVASEDATTPAATPAIPPGTYTFYEIKALLSAADPELATAMQAEISHEPPSPDSVAVPVAAVSTSCQNPPENAPSAKARVPYRAPSWDYEVPLTTRLAALQPSDLTTLEAIRASLTAAAPAAEADAP